MLIHPLPLGAAFGAEKNISFPGNACKQSSSELTNTALNEIDQSPQISVTQREGLEKWIVWESLSHFYFNEIKKFTFTVNKMYCTIFILYKKKSNFGIELNPCLNKQSDQKGPKKNHNKYRVHLL